MAGKTFSVVIRGNDDEQPFYDEKFGSVRQLINYLKSAVHGTRVGTVVMKFRKDLVAATGTVTAAAVIAGDRATINNVTFTGVISAPGNNAFLVTGTDADVATDLARAINASTSPDAKYVFTATSSGNVVTLTAEYAGRGGNAITLASSNAVRLLTSGARLAGGSESPPITHYF